EVMIGRAGNTRLAAELLHQSHGRLTEEPGSSRHDHRLSVPEGRVRFSQRRSHLTLPASWSSRVAISASTISSTSSLKRPFGSQPSFSRALLGSPNSESTSDGRK